MFDKSRCISPYLLANVYLSVLMWEIFYCFHTKQHKRKNKRGWVCLWVYLICVKYWNNKIAHSQKMIPSFTIPTSFPGVVRRTNSNIQLEQTNFVLDLNKSFVILKQCVLCDRHI